MWPLSGRTTGSPAPAKPAMAGRPVPAARTTWAASSRRPSVRTSAGPGSTAATVPATTSTRVPAAGLDERGEEGAVVHLMVAGDLDTAAQGGAQRRHEAAALAGAAPGGREAERVLVGEEVVEGGTVRRIEGDGHRARRVVADRVARGGLELGREGRPQARRPRGAAP